MALTPPRTEAVPRLTCSGAAGAYRHEPAPLAVSTAEPLRLRCVICETVVAVESPDDADA